MKIVGVLVVILFLVGFVFTLKNFVQMAFGNFDIKHKLMNFRNFIWGMIVCAGLFALLANFTEEFGIETQCNSYQLKNNPEQCHNNE